MRGLFAVAGLFGLFALVASCGFDPKPKDGKLPCDHGCPSGYVCRADKHCWLTNAPAVDSGVDGEGGSTIDAPVGTGGIAGSGGAGGGGGGTSGTGGAGATGGASGGVDGSIADGATDAPLGNPDGCAPESDQQLCTRLGKNCDAISGTDNCGQSRSILSCGACTAPLVCGTFVANVCPTVCVLDQAAILDQCVLGQ